VAALYLGNALTPTQAGAASEDEVRPSVLASRAGLYRNTITGMPLGVLYRDRQLSLEGAAAPANLLVAGSESHFESPESGRKYDFDSRGLRVTNPNGTVDVFERVERAAPTVADAAELTGSYASDEAETVLDVALNGNALVVKRRPGTTLALRPEYKDGFTAEGLGLVRFRRDAAGRVTALSVTVDRAWDVRFVRQ
jgi:hypothetical protein